MKLRVQGRDIGEDAPCFLAAEIGINHNGDMDLAREMIFAAAHAGADAVKFQNYRTDDFVTDRSLTHSYVSRGREVVESQYEMFRRCELPPGAVATLAGWARDAGVAFFSTPTGQDGIDELVRAGAAMVKNGSDMLTHVELVAAMARSGLCCVLSTGMATRDEIDDAVIAFREAGGRELILLHCTSSYPTPARDVHLRKLASLGARYGCPVGLSDHTLGIHAALGAVSLGASFIEKHFTLDRGMEGPDHAMSSDPAEFAALARGVREVESMLGHGELGPTEAEARSRESFRISCVARTDLAAGSRLEPASITFRRPGTGLPPKAADRLVGMTLTRALRSGAVLLPQDLR